METKEFWNWDQEVFDWQLYFSYRAIKQNSINNLTNIYIGLIIDNVISNINTFYNFQASTKLLF